MPLKLEIIKRNINRWLAVVAGGVCLALYLSTLAPSVLFGDAGEFQFVAPTAGIAHPTGYPVYLILGWLWTTLFPVGDAAFKMNLFSAVTAAAGIAILFLTILRLLQSADLARNAGLARAISMVSAILFAVTPTFWGEAVMAEVYALHAMLLSAAFYFLLRWLGGGRSWKALIPLAIAVGLGLAHHRTTILFAGGLVLTLWVASRRIKAPAIPARRIFLLIAITLVPLLFYLFIPLRAPHADYLQMSLSPTQQLELYQNDVPGFIYHVLGRSFEGSLRLDILTSERILQAFDFLRAEFTFPGILLGLAGLGWLLSRRRWTLLVATGPAFLFQLGFNLIYDIGDIHVMYIPLYLIWALWVAVGIGWLCREISNLFMRLKSSPIANGPASLSRRPPQSLSSLVSWVIVALCALLPLWVSVTNFSQVSRRSDWDAWNMWQRILAQPLPQSSVLVSNDRDEIMPLWYFQQVEGRRTDVIGLYPLIIAGDDYRDIGMTLEQALTSGRPVFLIKPMPGLEVRFAQEPTAFTMTRVVGPAAELPPARSVEAGLRDKVQLLGYTHSPYSVAPGKELTVALYWQSLAPMEHNYVTFVQLLDRAGNRVAGHDHLPGGDYYPTRLWKPGEALYDEHSFIVPANLPLGAYRLYVGMYEYPSLERLGDAQLGLIGLKSSIETQPRIPPHPREIYFEDRILFWGYELRKEGQSLLLTLQWQAINEMSLDYTTFVHLIDEEGNIVSQADSQPLGGTYPTSIWDKGEVVFDAYRLPIEMDMPAGKFELLIGLYRLEDLSRLQLFEADGSPIGDYLKLQDVVWP